MQRFSRMKNFLIMKSRIPQKRILISIFYTSSLASRLVDEQINNIPAEKYFC